MVRKLKCKKEIQTVWTMILGLEEGKCLCINIQRTQICSAKRERCWEQQMERFYEKDEIWILRQQQGRD